MKRIDEFVESVYVNVSGQREEVSILKEEMRNHLLQTVNDLIAEGKTEKESIDIAINRFGEKEQIQNELANVFRTQKKFGRVLLTVLIIFFIAGVSSLIVEWITNKNFIKRTNDLAWQSQMITDVAKKNNLKLLDETVRELFVETQKNQIAYVALVELPADFDIENRPKTKPINLGRIYYQYPENIQNVKEFGNNSGGTFFVSGNAKTYLEIGMKEYSNSNPYYFFKLIGIGFIMIYWVLFGMWAVINAFHLKRLSAAWIIIFFVLNVLGYLIFVADRSFRTFKPKVA